MSKKLTNGNQQSGRTIQVGNTNVIEHDERMVPEYHKGNEIYGEHLARYEIAKEIVKGKTLLDVASGSGYGTHLLASVAKKVFGVDVSPDAIKYSKEHYSRDNIEYLIGDGNKLPMPSKSVDVVTSFETIEHIEDYTKFLAEVKRVLKSNGVLVVSTPNDLEFTAGNHFHLHQFEEEELHKLLKKDYEYVEAYYQTTWLYSLIGDNSSFSKDWSRMMKVIQTTTINKNQVLYFYFLCSNKPIKSTKLELGAIGEHWSERKIREKAQLTDNHIDNLGKIIKSSQDYIKKLETDIKQLSSELHKIKHSKTYRITRKFKRTNND